MFSIKRFLPRPVREFIDKCEGQQSSTAVWGGFLFGLAGLYIFIALAAFSVNAELATLKFVAIESRVDDGAVSYRALFEIMGDENRRLRYSGNSWSSFMPHEVDEIVPGRVRWETGEIRSHAIMKRDLLISLLLFGVASFAFFQGRSALRDGSWLPWKWG